MSDKEDAVAAHEYQTWQESAAYYIENVAPMTARSGQISILQEIGSIQKSSAILELGCGTGDLIEQLAEIGGRTAGIDFSENMIRIASERFSHIEFKVADAESVPFQNDEFDVVVCNYTAHHFARPQKVFEEARRVLKPGGCAVVVMPIQNEQESFGAIVHSVVEELSPDEVPGGPLLYVDDPDDVAGVLTAAGFTEVMAEKRIKATYLDTINQLLRSGWAIMGLDDQPKGVQDRIRAATIERAEPFKQPDGTYNFPDGIIVACGHS